MTWGGIRHISCFGWCAASPAASRCTSTAGPGPSSGWSCRSPWPCPAGSYSEGERCCSPCRARSRSTRSSAGPRRASRSRTGRSWGLPSSTDPTWEEILPPSPPTDHGGALEETSAPGRGGRQRMSTTPAHGARRCASREGSSRRSPMRPPAPWSQHPRRRSPRTRAECATGTTAIRGCATPASPSTPCGWPLARTRCTGSSHGWCSPRQATSPGNVRSRSCTASGESVTSPSVRSIILGDGAVAARSGWGTEHGRSARTTSSVTSSMPPCSTAKAPQARPGGATVLHRGRRRRRIGVGETRSRNLGDTRRAAALPVVKAAVLGGTRPRLRARHRPGCSRPGRRVAPRGAEDQDGDSRGGMGR